MNHLQLYQQSKGLTPDGDIGPATAKVMMADLGITSVIGFCHLMGQVRVESNDYTAVDENLNYSAEALHQKFDKYFAPGEEAKFARKEERIANRIYANRNGNGPESTGDGWRYRGHGGLQLTGKSNIQAYFKFAGVPLDSDPAILGNPEHYFRCAVFYFNTNNVWKYCDGTTNTDILDVSRKVNLGNANSKAMPFGFDERLKYTKQLFKALRV